VTFSFLCISLTQHEATQAWLAGLEPAVSSVFCTQSFGLHLNRMNILNFANPFKVKFKMHLNIGVADV